MTSESFRLLLCTNGCETTRPSLAYGAWLAGLLKAPVTLLGIVEEASQQASVQALTQQVVETLDKNNIQYKLVIDKGYAPDVIARHAAQVEHSMVVVGPLGRPAWRRFMTGRSFRRLMARIQGPILYVPREHLRLQKVLVCLGGLGYADTVIQLCVRFAGLTRAEVTLLHVVEPITLDYPTSHEIFEHLENIQETDTPQGRNLRAAMQLIHAAGLTARLKIRRGSVVNEITDEIAGGHYDLVGMGSAYSVHSLRHLYMPNVTAEVGENVPCPILTVRFLPPDDEQEYSSYTMDKTSE
jgi:nucleotide-binding universal stress UspA family protein